MLYKSLCHEHRQVETFSFTLALAPVHPLLASATLTDFLSFFCFSYFDAIKYIKHFCVFCVACVHRAWLINISDGKFHLLPTGELLIHNLDYNDRIPSYRCRTMHRLTRQVVASAPAKVRINGKLRCPHIPFVLSLFAFFFFCIPVHVVLRDFRLGGNYVRGRPAWCSSCELASSPTSSSFCRVCVSLVGYVSARATTTGPHELFGNSSDDSSRTRQWEFAVASKASAWKEVEGNWTMKRHIHWTTSRWFNEFLPLCILLSFVRWLAGSGWLARGTCVSQHVGVRVYARWLVEKLSTFYEYLWRRSFGGW